MLLEESLWESSCLMFQDSLSPSSHHWHSAGASASAENISSIKVRTLSNNHLGFTEKASRNTSSEWKIFRHFATVGPHWNSALLAWWWSWWFSLGLIGWRCHHFLCWWHSVVDWVYIHITTTIIIIVIIFEVFSKSCQGQWSSLWYRIVSIHFTLPFLLT